jgi:hypothetical protein
MSDVTGMREFYGRGPEAVEHLAGVDTWPGESAVGCDGFVLCPGCRKTFVLVGFCRSCEELDRIYEARRRLLAARGVFAAGIVTGLRTDQPRTDAGMSLEGPGDAAVRIFSNLCNGWAIWFLAGTAAAGLVVAAIWCVLLMVKF